jgi:hypothetical protein
MGSVYWGVVVMEMNRKAVFFTVISIVVMSVVILYFSLNNTVDYFSGQTESRIDSYKISAGNDLVKIIEEVYLPLNIEYSARKALISLAQYVIENDQHLTDNNSLFGNFTTVFLNGTFYDPSSIIYTEPYLIDTLLTRDRMGDNDFYSRLNNLSIMIDDIYGYNFTYSIEQPFIYQSNETGHEYFGISLKVGYYSIAGKNINWTRHNLDYNLLVDIEGMLDPMHGYHGGFEHPLIINHKSSHTLAEFIDAVENMTYLHDYEGPSFFMRFYNSTHEDNKEEASCCGLVTMLNASSRMDSTSTFYSDILGGVDNSYADHCMWNQNCNLSKPGCYRLWDIDGMTSDSLGNNHYKFKITVTQAMIYNLSYSLLDNEYTDGLC